MVEKGDGVDAGDFKKAAGEFEVFVAWSRVAIGMVVRDDDGMCTPLDCLAEYFTWMHQRPVRQPSRDAQRFANRMMSGIESQHKKYFLGISYYKWTEERSRL